MAPYDAPHAAWEDTELFPVYRQNPDAIEAWAFDTVTFEHLLERLEPYRCVEAGDLPSR